MLIGGLSALIAQTFHPLAMAGVAGHSRYQDDPLDRLRRTARFVAGTTFGPTPFAENARRRGARGARAGARHRRRTAGAYAASDPELFTFVHVTEVFGFLAASLAYAPRPLLRTEKDRYLDEVAVVAELLGATEVPRSVARRCALLRRAIAARARADAQARRARSRSSTDPTGRARCRNASRTASSSRPRDLLAERRSAVVVGLERRPPRCRRVASARRGDEPRGRGPTGRSGPSVVRRAALDRIAAEASRCGPERAPFSSRYNRVPDGCGTSYRRGRTEGSRGSCSTPGRRPSCARSSPNTSRPASRSAPPTSCATPGSTSRRRRCAPTCRPSSATATSPTRTRAPGGSRPMRATASSSTTSKLPGSTRRARSRSRSSSVAPTASSNGCCGTPLNCCRTSPSTPRSSSGPRPRCSSCSRPPSSVSRRGSRCSSSCCRTARSTSTSSRSPRTRATTRSRTPVRRSVPQLSGVTLGSLGEPAPTGRRRGRSTRSSPRCHSSVTETAAAGE